MENKSKKKTKWDKKVWFRNYYLKNRDKLLAYQNDYAKKKRAKYISQGPNHKNIGVQIKRGTITVEF